MATDFESAGYQRLNSKPDFLSETTDFDDTYDYLAGMQVSSFSEENLTELQKQTENKQAELNAFMNSKEQMLQLVIAHFRCLRVFSKTPRVKCWST